ncbi:hypothetical protein FRC04_005938 [Tulasnella sp. 424]|nr:hypothetical protein FRC04_005938 [Tulasnella sp. 424]
MESIPDLSDTIEQLFYQQSGYWLTAGGATLLIYDWLLCLDREIQYIWKARWSFAKFWFICHRYAMMALVVGMVYASVKSSSEPSSLEWCKTWDRLSYIATIVIVAAIQGTFVLRVCALYRRSPYLIASLGATYLACSAVTLVFWFKLQNTVHYSQNSFAPYYVCVRTCDDCMRWGIYLYIPLLAIDAVILALTVQRAFVSGPQRNAAPILGTFLRDGITYFLIAFATALVNILFFVFGPPAMKPWMNKYVHVLVLALLNLRLLLSLLTIHLFSLGCANRRSYVRPLLSSMATHLLLNLHEQVSRTVHYSTDPPTTMNENGGNALSTIEFAPPDGERDVESVMYDVSGDGPSTSDKRRTEVYDGERRRFELKDLREADREGLRSGLGWVEAEGRLIVPGRRQCGPTKVDPG